MQDMLVKLYDLPNSNTLIGKLSKDGINIRKPLAAEKYLVVAWVEKKFGKGWASETEVSFSLQPIGCFIAVKEHQIIGFACFDACYRNFFGPTGIDEDYRGKGIGKALLLESLFAMKALGYAYAIIGGVGPAEYYAKTVGAVMINGSNPGVYQGILSEIPID